MRLWHYELIHYLPKSQLLAQWRELNSIFKNQPKHILINYVYEYPKEDLYTYTLIVIKEMNLRDYKINNLQNMQQYFNLEFGYFLSLISGLDHIDISIKPFKNHHNFNYLQQCFYNLEEKYERGQADFSKEQYEALNHVFYKIPF